MKFKRELLNGFIIFALIAIYFIILEVLGLSNNSFLRLFNILFVGYGVNRTLKGNIDHGITGYFRNFISGFITSTIGAILSISALLMYIYFNGGEAFLKEMSTGFLIGGGEVSSYQYVFSLLLFESSAASFIVVYCLMQYWKGKVEVINKVD
ncbi:MAG: hypothetical protein IR153_01480 [Flavobacterium sp.]|nr:hypothetical protein [Flavobacterium sp.]